jgi:hypothetical protein
MRVAQLTLPRFDLRAPVYNLAIVLGLILDLTGALHVYGLSALASQRLATGAALLLTVVAASWLVVAAKVSDDGLTTNVEQSPIHHPSQLVQRILTLLILLAWLATTRDFLGFLSPGITTPRLLVFGGGALALVLAVFRPPAVGWVTVGAVLLGGVVRLASFRALPIDPANGDMLPLVHGALGNLLAGHSPYTTYYMPWELPLTYLPATWLAYLLPYLLGFDIRLTNLCAELAIGAVIFWLAITRKYTLLGGWHAALVAVWHNEQSMLLWAWVFLQPTTLNWSLATTAPVLWALLAALLALLIAEYNRGAAFFLGLCAAASPLASVVAPFALLRWLRSSGIRGMMLYFGIASLITITFILPFLLWSPQQFIYGTWRWFNDNELFPRQRWEMDNTWARIVGFSGMFWRHNLIGVLKPLQGLILASIVFLYWRWGATRRRLAPLSVAAFLLFTAFNPILWPYLYNPALIGALIAVAALDQTTWCGMMEIGTDTSVVRRPPKQTSD